MHCITSFSICSHLLARRNRTTQITITATTKTPIVTPRPTPIFVAFEDPVSESGVGTDDAYVGTLMEPVNEPVWEVEPVDKLMV